MINKQQSFDKIYYSHNPKPVICLNKRLAVFFCAKSGCTFIVKWFFNQIDQLTAALDFHPFVHRYRWMVYSKSKHFIESEKRFIKHEGKDFLKIKVIRNPFERAVSSYIHFLEMLANKHKEINNNFGIGYQKMDYSFAEFLNLLEKIDINSCNIHWRQQFHFIEKRIKFDHIIYLKDSIKELLKLEKIHNFKKSKNIDRLAQSNHHSSKKTDTDKDTFCGFSTFSVAIKKNRPLYKSFYNFELEEKVRKIYKIDFEEYSFNYSYTT